MQAVILAGGLGTRLRPLTHDIPKPMVPVAGAPYLEHQLRLLAQQSITDIVLLVGYLGDQIEGYFGDGSDFGLSIRYSWEMSPQGTGGALRDAAGLVDDQFLVIYGDSYLPIPYGEVLDTLQRTGALGVLSVYDNGQENTGVVNNVALDREGVVVRYDKDASRDPEELQYVEAGVLGLRREVVSSIGSGKVSLEQEVFPQLIEKRRLVSYVTQQRFYDIGTPERLRQIEHVFHS